MKDKTKEQGLRERRHLRLIPNEKSRDIEEVEGLEPPAGHAFVPARASVFTIRLDPAKAYKAVLVIAVVLLGAILDYQKDASFFLAHLDEALLGIATCLLFKALVEDAAPEEFREDADPDWEDGVD